MKLLRILKKYIVNEFDMSYWVHKYNLNMIEDMVFSFLVFFTWVFATIFYIVSFVTFPIWIIPYLVYKTVTEEPGKEVEE